MTSLLLGDRTNEKTFDKHFINGHGVPYGNGHDAPANGLNGHNGDNGHNGHDGHGAEERVLIRPYRAEDRADILRICCDTGFLGNPIETIFRDREIFAELFAAPYLNYGPDWAWVADDGHRVVGYLLGSVSPSFHYALLYSGFQTTVKLITRAATGCYSGHPRTRHFIRWLLTNGYREQPRHPENAAHLHFNIEKSHRGHGLARRLWRAYEEQMCGAGVRNCYGAFFSLPKRRPEAVYARLGFSVFDRKRTTMFYPEIKEPVEIVCVHREIAG